MVRFAWLLVALAGCVAGVASAPSGDSSSKVVAPFTPAIPAVGCSATACHGSLDHAVLTRPPDEYCSRSSATIYHALDPHTRAFAALEGDNARKIMRLLNWNHPATQEARCLACHAECGSTRNFSCEACHGSSEKWLAPHTLGHDNLQWRASAKSLGFNDLRTNAATVCAGCHIGAGGTNPKDMNHDMIAAGHPALGKSYSQLIESLPPHWSPKHEPYEIIGGWDSFWMAGINLSRDRRQRGPWTEFAEMNCKQCHHNLVVP